MRRVTLAAGLAAIALASSAAHAGHGSVGYDAALRSAIETGKPVLIKLGAEWCSACKAFDKAVAENAAFKSGIESQAVLCQLDAEKGEGVSIARGYSVQGYPTFILANAEGELMDRWIGFGKTEEFDASLTAALEEPVSVRARLERFAKHPSATDAVKLGDLRLAEGLSAEAIAYYQRAMDLEPSNGLDARVFEAMAKGYQRGLYAPDALKTTADAVYANANTEPDEMMHVLWTMRKVASKTDDADYYVPYLKAVVERTTGDESPYMSKSRGSLEADYALHVKKNTTKAIALKKASMPEGWTDQSNMLNNFAWWCFESKINLDEAERLARKGVELAPDGAEKAMILDTVAEICNIKGDCGEALELIRAAIAEDPDNDFYRQQEDRFAELLAQQEAR